MNRAPIKLAMSQSELQSIFVYDEQSGKLFWKERPGRKWFNSRFTGKEVGSKNGSYMAVHLEGGNHYLHRIIWKLKTGEEPVGYIDHIDGNGLNNAWSNLRDVTHDQNMWNAKLFHNNTSGYRGVSFIQSHGLWRAAISIGGKKKHIGYFESAEAAHAAFVDASAKARDEYAKVA